MTHSLLASISLEFWYLLPLGVVVAMVATSSGLAGSNFWIPIYLRGLALEPRLVFWMSLVTMVFGFGSAVLRNLVAGTVDWGLVRRYGVIAAPATAVAALVAARLSQQWLLVGFSVFALAHGVALIASSGGRRGSWRLPWLPTVPAALAGGLSQGLIATGAGTFTLPSMLAEVRGHHARAVGASVLLVFACTLIAVGFRFDPALVEALEAHSGALAGMVVFAAPGVVIGGQLGPRLARRIPEAAVRPYLGTLLVLVAALVATRAF